MRSEVDADTGADAAAGACDEGDFAVEAAMVGAGVVGRMTVLHIESRGGGGVRCRNKGGFT